MIVQHMLATQVRVKVATLLIHIVVSTAFIGKSPIARHRLAHAAVIDLMRRELHALSIRARTPTRTINLSCNNSTSPNLEMMMTKITYQFSLPLLALSSALLFSGTASAAQEEKKAESAPAATTPAPAEKPVAAKPVAAKPAEFTIPDPVAVVNGTPISKAAFDQQAQQLRGKVTANSLDTSKALIDQLILEELLVQEAGKQKLANDPKIKQQLEMAQRSILASAVVREVMNKNKPDESAIKKEYETATKAMQGKEYRASHILVDSEDKAKAIIAELKKGGKFAELAKTRSSDSSAAKGGDLGWFTPGMMVPPFAKAVEKLEKGKYSQEPVQTPFGWHVILLQDTRNAKPPTLEKLRPQITQMLRSRMVNDYLKKLRADAKVEVMEIKVSETKPAAADAKKADKPAAAADAKKADKPAAAADAKKADNNTQ